MSNSEQNKAETIIDLGRRTADADVRVVDISHPDNEANSIPCALEVREGNEEIVPLRDILEILDSRQPLARNRDGTMLLTDAESLIATVKRYGSDRTIVYASVANFCFTAVLDDHPAGPAGTPEDKAGWRRHRAQYQCPRSPEWLAWSALDGKALRQTAFADFLEERLADITGDNPEMPKPLEMLQVARKLNIKTKGEFSREINPTNGDFILINKSETTSDSTQIPRAFEIAIPVFEGGERYRVECRVRFTLNEGSGPAFSFIMHRRAEIERDAFMGVRALIATETKRLILSGNP